MKIQHYSIKLDGGGEASFGYCGKAPLSEEFLRSMKQVMEAAADAVRDGKLDDMEGARVDGNNNTTHHV